MSECAQSRPEAHGRFGGKILRAEAAYNSDQRQQYQQTAMPEYISTVLSADPDIDDVRHYQRDKQIK